MKQSQLIELIMTLKTEEMQHLLQSSTLSYFNQGKMKERVQHLLELCFKHFLDPSAQNLEKKEVFSILFPSQIFLEGKVEKVMVEAHKVVRAFLLAQRYFSDENEFHQIFDFSRIVRTRGLEIRHSQLMARLEKMQSDAPFRNADFFQRQFLLESAIHDTETLHNFGKGSLNVPQTLYALEVLCCLNRLELLNQYLLQQKIANLDPPEIINNLLESFVLPSKYLEDSPSIKINYKIFNLLQKSAPTPLEVQSLFDLLLNHEKELDSESLHEFYAYLRNLCTLILSQDYENLEIEYMLHELYIVNLKKGYLHYEGKLNRTRYWMISNNALRVKNYDWALEFIEKYKFELRDENETQDIYRMNFANYLFGTGRFSECLDYIPITTPFTEYQFLGKRLELKALYEIRSELLPYKLDAFKMFLSRTSPKLLSETQRQTNSDFANLLYQLVYSNPGDPKRSELLTKRIQEKKQSAEWRWLLEKAKGLKEN